MVDQRIGYIDAEGRRRKSAPETANNTPEPTVNKKDFNKREETQEISYPSRDTFLKYPVDNNFPVSMLYRVREVVPPIQGALEQVNEVYSNYAPDDMVYVQSGIAQRSQDGGLGVGGGGSKKETVNDKSPFNNSKEIAAAKRAIERQKFMSQPGARVGMLGFKTKYPKRRTEIQLYMPPGVMIGDTVNYDTGGLGLGGAAALQTLNNAEGVKNSIKAALTETAKSLGGLFGMNRGGNMETARVAMARGVSMAGGVLSQNLQNAASLGLQVKVNPNTRSIFNGVNVRNFSFSYDFYPTSRFEQEQVLQIIKRFRSEVYPRTIPPTRNLADAFPLGYKFPNLFEIQFKFGSNIIKHMPQPLYSFLRGVTTNYNPTSMGFHEDGHATHISMSLNFQEFRALNREDVELRGY
jgi:hypothetical protein